MLAAGKELQAEPDKAPPPAEVLEVEGAVPEGGHGAQSASSPDTLQTAVPTGLVMGRVPSVPCVIEEDTCSGPVPPVQGPLSVPRAC